MIYGATGYTGELIVAEAVRRGHRPILAGRSAAKLERLGAQWQLPTRAVGLDDPAALRAALEGVDLVLHAAGPFARTSLPMLQACLDVRAHYLDITGELAVFVQTYAHDAAARERGVAAIPGVGLDVIPTDCLAAHVARRAPGATSLEIALAGMDQTSQGTAKSMLGVVAGGIWTLREGKLVRTPFGRGVKRVRFSDAERWVVPSPLGDLVASRRSTGIENITTYFALPGNGPGALRWAWPLLWPWGPVLRWSLRRRWLVERLERRIDQEMTGPDATYRSSVRARIWVRAGEAESTLDCPEGYQFTLHASVLAVERVLAQRPVGALSPAQALGPDFVLEIPGTERRDVR